jgi:hypothetical protein
VSGDELPKHVNCIGHQAYLGVHRADLMHKPVKCFNKYENATYPSEVIEEIHMFFLTDEVHMFE